MGRHLSASSPTGREIERMRFRTPHLYGLIEPDLIWVRAHPWSIGLTIKRTKPLFSERNGYTKSHRLPFGWRWHVLTEHTDDR